MSDFQSPQCQLAVLIEEQYRQLSIELAARLQLPILEPDSPQLCLYHYVFIYLQQGLVLQQTGPKAVGPVCVDFTGGGAQHRRLRGGGELIVKAVGAGKQQRPLIVDATAGLGRDSFVLASWGYPIIALERNPMIISLLSDALARAKLSHDPELQEIISRIQIVHTDAIDYLHTRQVIDRPDVIYIDPMFPQTTKSALVKKQMRVFQQLVGVDQDSDQLLNVALQTADYRVVVKRPRKSDFIAGRKPAFSLPGKAIRFDVYCLKSYKH